MYKSFDPYLNNRLFIGREGNEDWKQTNYSTVSLLTSHCFGAEAGHPYLKMCLDFYTDRHFIRCLNNDYPQHLKYDMLILPKLQTEVAFLWGYKWESENDKLQELKDGMVIYPHDYFDYPKYTDMKNVVCIHRQFGGWRPNSKGHHKSYEATHHVNNFKQKFQRSLLLTINKFFYKIYKIYISISDEEDHKLCVGMGGGKGEDQAQMQVGCHVPVNGQHIAVKFVFFH